MRREMAGAPLFFVLALLCGHAYAQPTWRPERAVEIVVGTSPGGGTDLTARVLQKVLQERQFVDSAIVVNKPGGGQTVSWVYMNQHAGDGHYLNIVNEPLLTNRIMGVSPLAFDDFTPIALLFREQHAYSGAAETRRFLDVEYQPLSSVFSDLGLAKTAR